MRSGGPACGGPLSLAVGPVPNFRWCSPKNLCSGRSRLLPERAAGSSARTARSSESTESTRRGSPWPNSPRNATSWHRTKRGANRISPVPSAEASHIRRGRWPPKGSTSSPMTRRYSGGSSETPCWTPPRSAPEGRNRPARGHAPGTEGPLGKSPEVVVQGGVPRRRCVALTGLGSGWVTGPRGVAPGWLVSAPSGQRSARGESQSGGVGRGVSIFRIGMELRARRCDLCGNIQMFARAPKAKR
jgi:hypothetical protein